MLAYRLNLTALHEPLCLWLTADPHLVSWPTTHNKTASTSTATICLHINKQEVKYAYKYMQLAIIQLTPAYKTLHNTLLHYRNSLCVTSKIMVRLKTLRNINICINGPLSTLGVLKCTLSVLHGCGRGGIKVRWAYLELRGAYAPKITKP